MGCVRIKCLIAHPSVSANRRDTEEVIADDSRPCRPCPDLDDWLIDVRAGDVSSQWLIREPRHLCTPPQLARQMDSPTRGCVCDVQTPSWYPQCTWRSFSPRRQKNTSTQHYLPSPFASCYRNPTCTCPIAQKPPTIPLPKAWKKHVRSAVLRVLSLCSTPPSILAAGPPTVETVMLDSRPRSTSLPRKWCRFVKRPHQGCPAQKDRSAPQATLPGNRAHGDCGAASRAWLVA